MRIDIGNNLKYLDNFLDNTLPKASESYESIILEQGSGQFIEAFLEFDDYKILVQIKVDDDIKAEIDLKDLKDFKASELDCSPSVCYFDPQKVLKIKFPLPIQFNTSFEILAKTNDGNKTKKLKGYQVVFNKERG